jgi:hypothetical protein
VFFASEENSPRTSKFLIIAQILLTCAAKATTLGRLQSKHEAYEQGIRVLQVQLVGKQTILDGLIMQVGTIITEMKAARSASEEKQSTMNELVEEAATTKTELLLIATTRATGKDM